MNEVATNKLSIYLIKEEYSSPKEILKEHDRLKTQNIGDDVGTFYYVDSRASTPAWIKNFFGDSFSQSSKSVANENMDINIFGATSKAILLVSTEKRTFALAFGFGYTLLQQGTWEEGFGLKVALNLVEPGSLRSIDKKNMSIIPKHSREQLTKEGTFADFGIDVEQDLIKLVTGKLEKDKHSGEFGTGITGADSLHVSVKKDISNIKYFLDKCFEKFMSDKYKKEFRWIDNISAVKNPDIVKILDIQLVKNINKKKLEKIWTAVPEILDWANVSEFKFKEKSFGDDINLITYLRFLSDEDKDDMSVEIIKKDKIECISANGEYTVKSWSVYNCLYCEVKHNNKTYILSDGKWYDIDNNFEKDINESFADIKAQPPGIKLSKCQRGEHEGEYNKRIAKESSDISKMDGKFIHHGGKNQKIEFCDLFTKDKQIIHVKHYGASSVLSHLFSQGLVSAELFISDQGFREKLNKKLEDNFKLADTSDRPNPSDYEIIFAIIKKDKDNEDLNIPFFSKVNIRNAKKRLDAFGYKVSLLKISTDPTENIKGSD